jgi:hypothetical protein
LLLVRDPVAAVILIRAYRARLLVWDPYMRALAMLFGGFATLGGLQLINGIGTPLVAAYGVRAYFLHLPVAFVMGRVLGPRDLRRLLTAFLLIAIPMAALMAVQFESAPNSWINAGVRGHTGQIAAAKGHIRPPGTFSFIDGPIGFFGVVLATLVASQLDPTLVPWAIRWSAWIALCVGVAVSGSRSMLATCAGVCFAGLAGWCRSTRRQARAFASAAVIAAIAANVVGAFDTVQEGADVLQSRFGTLAGGEFSRRLTHEFRTIEWALIDAPPLGVGLGAGTNAAAAYQGTKGFRWGEGEWPRVIFEAGPILGLLYLIARVWLAWRIARAALDASATGAITPLLLFGASAMSLISGQWGQATIQGFGVFTIGLCLAAGRCAVRDPLSAADPRPVPTWMMRRVGFARG